MEKDSGGADSAPSLMLRLPLYSCVVREHVWLRKFTVSRPYLRRAVEDPRLFRDFSVLKTIRADESSGAAKEQAAAQPRQRAQEGAERQLKLYEDFQWSRVPGYYWPIHSGDYSPLSPDGEFLERHGKIGLDFWQWHRESSPLGYVPPLCTCKRTEDCVKYLLRWSRNMRLDFEHRVCENDVCRGLLYIPYSLLEIPLNRAVSNGSEFALKVRVPDCTDVYCGNMKHTIILCTTSRAHEQECLEAVELSELPAPLVYDVCPDDFVPYFKRYSEASQESPLMTVEPIDSDVSEPEANYGLGQLFAIRRLGENLLIEKYDLGSKTISPIDDPLVETWDKMCSVDLGTGATPGGPAEPEEGGLGAEGHPAVSPGPEQSPQDRPVGTPGAAPAPKVDARQILDDFKELGGGLEDASGLRAQLQEQEYKVYELIESFSSDRRPLYLTLRTGAGHSCSDGHPHRGARGQREPPGPRSLRVDRRTMQAVHLLNEISKI